MAVINNDQGPCSRPNGVVRPYPKGAFRVHGVLGSRAVLFALSGAQTQSLVWVPGESGLRLALEDDFRIIRPRNHYGDALWCQLCLKPWLDLRFVLEKPFFQPKCGISAPNSVVFCF